MPEEQGLVGVHKNGLQLPLLLTVALVAPNVTVIYTILVSSY